MIATAEITNRSMVDGADGLEIDSVTIVVDFRSDDRNYFSGQVLLTAKDDGVTFQSKTDDLKQKAIAKVKDIVATSDLENKTVDGSM